MNINYSDAFGAWKDFEDKIYSLIKTNDYKNIAEIGGGANPILPVEFIRANKINYTIIDSSSEEMSKADAGYQKTVLDFEKKLSDITVKYDLIFAQMTMEHIRYPSVFYSNVHKLLTTGGQALFFFACSTSLPMLLNKLIPDFITKRILLSVQPFRKDEKHGKFKAYYKWCYGPTKTNIKRLENLNFQIVEYTGYFGHSYYAKFALLNSMEKRKTNYLLKHPNPYLCSYSHVLLRRVE